MFDKKLNINESVNSIVDKLEKARDKENSKSASPTRNDRKTRNTAISQKRSNSQKKTSKSPKARRSPKKPVQITSQDFAKPNKQELKELKGEHIVSITKFESDFGE